MICTLSHPDDYDDEYVDWQSIVVTLMAELDSLREETAVLRGSLARTAKKRRLHAVWREDGWVWAAGEEKEIDET